MNIQSLIKGLLELKPKLYLSDEELLHKENNSPQTKVLDVKHPSVCSDGEHRSGNKTEDDYLNYSCEPWFSGGSMSEKPRWNYEGGSL